MKVLILGGSGMLGHKLVQVLKRSFDVAATFRTAPSDYADLQIFDQCRIFEKVDARRFSTVRRVIYEFKPDVVINAIGVIKQRSDARDIIKTLEINSVFPHKAAEVARDINARFVTFSTDCVFSGEKGNYTEKDIPDALDLYGKSKHLGEVTGKNCLTLRTSIIGRELKSERSLIEWFLSNQNGHVKGFKRAIFSGFPTIVLAGILVGIIKDHKYLEGLYHLSSDPINKYHLLKLIKNKLGLQMEIEPDDEFVIDRSLDSTKFSKATGFRTDKWETLIGKLFDDPTPYNQWRKKIS